MGEVYRAHDTKLSRDVALKILSYEFARDRERVARFRREARTTAWTMEMKMCGSSRCGQAAREPRR